MSANRPLGPSRRERERRTRRNERLVIGSAAGVLGLAGLVVLIGLYITWYQPPRAHVLSVGDSDYNASAVERRALYELRYGDAGLSGFDSAVPETLDLIEDGEVVLARAPALVGDVPDAEVRADLFERLGLEEGADAEFPEALAGMLRDSRLSRAEIETIITANILVGRVRDTLVAEFGDVTPQALLSRIRIADEAAAGEIWQQASEGADFGPLALERGSGAGAADPPGDIGWYPLAALSPEAQAALEGLEPGSVSAIVRDGPLYDIYLVRERDEARAIDEDQRASLGALRFLDWIEAERDAVEVVVDLSPGEERWILERLIDDLASARTAVSGGSP